jgi:hypothetical protein
MVNRSTNPLSAADILKNPSVIDQFPGPYAMLVDGSFLSGLGIPRHERMVEALNVLAGRGWEAVSIANDRGAMFALIKRSRQA